MNESPPPNIYSKKSAIIIGTILAVVVFAVMTAFFNANSTAEDETIPITETTRKITSKSEETEPETTTEETTSVPEITTAVPETTTVVPETETAVPETTTEKIIIPLPLETKIATTAAQTTEEEPVNELVGAAVFWATTGTKTHLNPYCSSFKYGFYYGTYEQAITVRTNGWCKICSSTEKTGEYSGKNNLATNKAINEAKTYNDYLKEFGET